MKKSLGILLILTFLTAAFSGCSSFGSGNFEYDPPEISELVCYTEGVYIAVEPVAGVSSYRILRKTGSERWTVLDHTDTGAYYDRNVESAVSYSYTVLCESADGTTPLSDYSRTGQTITFMDVPELSSAVNVYGGVKIEWKAPKGAQRYRIIRREEKEEDWVRVADTTSLTFTDTTAENGTSYVYSVRVVSKDGTPVSFFDRKGLSVTYYAAPVISSAIGVNNTVRLSWKKVDGADSYRVYRKDSAEGAWAAIEITSATSFVDRTAAPGRTYTYTVRCMDAAGRLISSFDPEGFSVNLP